MGYVAPNEACAITVRILFIHEVNYLNKVIFEMHEFPELMALRGHDVTFFHYPEEPDERVISMRSASRNISGRVHPEAQIRLVTPPTFGGHASERYIAPILSLASLRNEIVHGKYDVIVLYAVPTTGWQAVAFARRAGVPIVYRALDVSHQIRSNPLSSLIQRAERYVAKNSSMVSGNNPAMTSYCVRMSHRIGPAVTNLPPIDLAHFIAADASQIRPELGLTSSDKVLLYMGTFFEFSGLDVLIDELEPYFSSHPDLKLVLIGGGELDFALRDTVKSRGLQRQVIFTGVIPYAKLPGYLKSADVAVNPFRKELLTDVALPHKVLQYMAAGVPAVSTNLDGLRGVLGEDSGVTLVDGPQHVAQAAVQIAYSSDHDREEIGRRQRDYVDRTFSHKRAVDDFEKTLTSLANSN